MSKLHHLRIARPVSDLRKSQTMYCRGLDLQVIGSFTDHDGFDGVMLGHEDAMYHLEFTHARGHSVEPRPTPEDLLVLYVPIESEWNSRCAAMVTAGFKRVRAFNPYWEQQGATFEDHDGYRVVLQRSEWRNSVEG